MARITATTAFALFALLAWGDLLSAKPARDHRFTEAELWPLMNSLEETGYPRAFLEEIFSDSRLKKMEQVVGFNTVTEETEDRYEQFLSPYAIRLARRFRRRQFSKLAGVEAAYGVPAEIVVAILLVETQFGRARLPFRVLDVFTTMVVESGPAGVEKHFQRLKATNPDLERPYLAARMERKNAWAFRELAALLAIARIHGKDIFELRGSYSGAFGMPQFLPTSYQLWAVDGNGDQQVDLDNLGDALASIANYLRAHGWTADAGLAEKMRAVWKYNNSIHYVDAVFGISRKLLLPSRKRIHKS